MKELFEMPSVECMMLDNGSGDVPGMGGDTTSQTLPEITSEI